MLPSGSLLFVMTSIATAVSAATSTPIAATTINSTATLAIFLYYLIMLVPK